MSNWVPEKRGEHWVVVIKETPKNAPVIRAGGDGNPLRFFSEKAAQIHADSLNPATYILD